MVLYSAAGPEYGNVPPITTWCFDTPGVPLCDAAAEPATAAVTSRPQSSAPSVLRLTCMNYPSNCSISALETSDCVYRDDFGDILMEIDWRFKREPGAGAAPRGRRSRRAEGASRG